MNIHWEATLDAIGGCIQAAARFPILIPGNSMYRYVNSEMIIVAGMLRHESSNIPGAAPE